DILYSLDKPLTLCYIIKISAMKDTEIKYTDINLKFDTSSLLFLVKNMNPIVIYQLDYAISCYDGNLCDFMKLDIGTNLQWYCLLKYCDSIENENIRTQLYDHY